MTHCDIIFVDRENGWIVSGGPEGPGAIYRTRDGGESWEEVARCQLNAQDHRFFNGCFIDRDTGWVCGEHGDEEDGVLWATTDGGDSWDVWEAGAPGTGLPLSQPFFQVFFPSPRRGFILSAGLPMLTSEDGGRTWSPCEIHDAFPYGVSFLAPERRVGFLVSQDVDPITWQAIRTCHFRSDDGGESWQPLNDVFEDKTSTGLDVAACRFFDTQRGLLCGPEGALYRTEDGARSWQNVPHQLPREDLNTLCVSACFRQSSGEMRGHASDDGSTGGVAFVGGSGGLLARSDDGGRSWRQLRLPVSYRGCEIHSVLFLDELDGFIVGDDDLALRTRDGGKSWEPLELP